MRPNHHWKQQFHGLFDAIENNNFDIADQFVSEFCHKLREAANKSVDFHTLIQQLSWKSSSADSNAFYWLGRALKKNYFFGVEKNTKKIEYIEKIFNVLQSSKPFDYSEQESLLILSSEWRGFLIDYIESCDIYFLKKAFNNFNVFSQLIIAGKKTESGMSELRKRLDLRIDNEKKKFYQLLPKAGEPAFIEKLLECVTEEDLDALIKKSEGNKFLFFEKLLKKEKSSLHIGESKIFNKYFFDYLDELSVCFLNAFLQNKKYNFEKYFSIFERMVNQCIEQKQFFILLSGLCKEPKYLSGHFANALDRMMGALCKSAYEKDAIGVAQNLSLFEKILTEAIAQKQFSVLFFGLCEKPAFRLPHFANALGRMISALCKSAYEKDTAGVAKNISLLKKIIAFSVEKERTDTLFNGLLLKNEEGESSVSRILYTLKCCVENKDISNAEEMVSLLNMLFEQGSDEIVRKKAKVLKESLLRDLSGVENQEDNKEKTKLMIQKNLKRSKMSSEKRAIIFEEMGFSLEDIEEDDAPEAEAEAMIEEAVMPAAEAEEKESSEPLAEIEEEKKSVSPVASEYADEEQKTVLEKIEDSFYQRLEGLIREVEDTLSHEVDSESDKQKREAFYSLLEQANNTHRSIPDKVIPLLQQLEERVFYMLAVQESLREAELAKAPLELPSYESVLADPNPYAFLDALQAQFRARYTKCDTFVEFDPFSEHLTPVVVVAEEPVKIEKSTVQVQHVDGTVEERVVTSYNSHGLFAAVAATAEAASAMPEKIEEQKLAEILACLSVPSEELAEVRIAEAKKAMSA